MTRTLSRREFSRIAIAAAGAAACPALAAGQQQQDVSWLAEIQTAPAPLPDDALQLQIVNERGKPFASRDEWQPARQAIRRWWLDFLGPPPAPRKTKPQWEVLAEDRPEGVIRQRVRYEVEPGITTEAYLLRPQQASGKLPAVAVFHSTVDHSLYQPAGVKGRPQLAFGLKLARLGYVTISPRNYLWPTNDKIAAQQEADRFHQRHPQSKGMMRMLHDSLVAVDILASLPEVDANRIGSVGHSLGAKEVLSLAALDGRVKVTVSSEGGVGTRFSNWDADWYLGPTIKSPDFQREHHELLALAAPRPFLLLGGDSADGDRSWPFIEAALPIYRLYGGAPRLGLFNHKQGHAVPHAAEQRIYEWFTTYL